MARLAGMTLRERWSGWQREPFTSDSTKHVSVWEKTTSRGRPSGHCMSGAVRSSSDDDASLKAIRPPAGGPSGSTMVRWLHFALVAEVVLLPATGAG
jgi:hypothetical protein